MKNLHLDSVLEKQSGRRLKAHSLFLTRGIGQHPIQLVSFELALRDAYLEAQNLVSVSSIYPPQCKRISREEGVTQLLPGEITFCVLSRSAIDGSEEGRLVGSGVGLALPSDPDRFGYIFETHTFDKDEAATHTEAREGALLLLSSSIDPTVDVYNIDSIPQSLRDEITSDSMVYVAESRKGMWTTVVAAAIYVMP